MAAISASPIDTLAAVAWPGIDTLKHKIDSFALRLLLAKILPWR
jgi:hypothetical protein